MKRHMRDLREYLRAYRAYVSAGVGWGKALTLILVWLLGIFAPLGLKMFAFKLPLWLAVVWMATWSVVGYIFAPYGMWRYHRVTKPDQPHEMVAKGCSGTIL